MTTLLDKLCELTIKLAKSDESTPYERFEELINLREQAIHELQQQTVIEAADKEKIRLVEQYDSLIRQRLCALRDQAAKELKLIQTGRVQRTGYDTFVPNDSYFVDYRK